MAKKDKPQATKKGVLREGPYRLPQKPDGLKQITKWQ